MQLDMKFPGSVLGIRQVVGMIDSLLASIGADRIDVVTATRNRLCLHPRNLSEGEQIARLLGCDTPEDHHLITPGYTMWTRQHDDLVVQVRAELRRPTGASW